MPRTRIADPMPGRPSARAPRLALLLATLIAAPTVALAEGYRSEAEVIDELLNADMSAYRLDHDTSVARLADVDWSKAERIHVEFDDNWFEPERIQMRVDQPYRLSMKNIGYEQHDIIGEEFFSSILVKMIRNETMTIEAFHIERMLVPPRGELELWLLPVRATTLDFACTVPGHLEEGMIGTIEIVD